MGLFVHLSFAGQVPPTPDIYCVRSLSMIQNIEGNDLSNLQTAYQQLQTEGSINIARNTDQAVAQNASFQIVTSADGNYLYPLIHFLEDRQLELAYISDYLWWLNGDPETFAQSRNAQLLA